MKTPLADNPKITFALFKLEDELNDQRANPDADFVNITTHKDEVLARYQPLFSPDHLPALTKVEFESFLLFKNNHHWTDMQRVQKFITEDMALLRNALLILLDEGGPVQDRLNEIRPERSWATKSMVSHLGMPMLTAILQVISPSKYGVWNNTSDAGMKAVRLWDKKWEQKPAGNCYLEMNEIYLYLAEKLRIDLWTLDALWWTIKNKA